MGDLLVIDPHQLLGFREDPQYVTGCPCVHRTRVFSDCLESLALVSECRQLSVDHVCKDSDRGEWLKVRSALGIHGNSLLLSVSRVTQPLFKSNAIGGSSQCN